MASYCEVCRGMYFTPHPHAVAQRGSTLCPYTPLLPPRHATHEPPSPSSFSQRLDTCFDASTSNMLPSCGLTSTPALRSSSVPCASSAFAPRQRDGLRDCCICPCQSRSFSEPVSRPRQPHCDNSISNRPAISGRKGACSSTQPQQRRSRASTPPPLPRAMPGRVAHDAAWAGGDGCRYLAETFSSLQRSKGCLPAADYLRRGEGVVGQRQPSRPPSREFSRRPSPPSPSSLFFDSVPSQRAREEQCCYPSPYRVPQWGSAQEQSLSSAQLDAMAAYTRRPADHRESAFRDTHRDASPLYPQSCHRSDHHHHHDRRLQGSEMSAGVDGEQAVPPRLSRGHHRHRRSLPRDHSGHPQRPSSHVQSSSAPHDAAPRSQPPPLLSGAASKVPASPQHTPQLVPAPRRPMRHAPRVSSPSRSYGREEEEEAVKASAAAPAAGLGSSPPRPFSTAAKRATWPTSSAMAQSSLGELIAKIRAEVNRGAATKSATATDTGQSEAAREGSGQARHAAEAASTKPSADDAAAAAAASSFSSLPFTASTPARVAENVFAVQRESTHATPKQQRKSKEKDVRPAYASHSSGEKSGEDKPVSRRNQKGRISTQASTSKTKVQSAEHLHRSFSSSSSGERPRCTSRRCSRSSSSGASSQRSASSKELRRTVLEAEAVLHEMRRRATRQDDTKRRHHSTRSRSSKYTSQQAQSRKQRASSVATDDGSGREEDCRGDRQPPLPQAPIKRHAAGAEISGQGRQVESDNRNRSRSRPISATPHNQGAFHPTQPPPPSLSTGAEPAVEASLAATVTADGVRSTAADLAAKLQRQQEEWCAEHSHRVERLREGLSSLCVAVRKDLRKLRDEVNEVRAQSSNATVAVDAAAESAQRASQVESRTKNERVDAFPPECVLTWVAQCSSADQRRLAQLLLPHLRPALTDVIRDEVQRQLHMATAEHHEQLLELEGRLRAYVAEAIVTAQQDRSQDSGSAALGNPTPSAVPGAPLWAGFSSADAFNAHLRATARAVLSEEDDRRYNLASENERRHEQRVRELQQYWQETLSEAQRVWRAEWRSMLDKAETQWTHNAQEPLQQHADVMQSIVKALTRDVTSLHERQGAQAISIEEALQRERQMRQREHAQLTERVEAKVREMLPRQVESACVRYHVQRERAAATELHGTHARHGGGAAAAAAATATPALQVSTEELRLSVVQPALDHMRRLLASHQEMVNAAVEDRCRRAESVVEGNRHVWLQNVTELRGKVSALRTDVRGAFNELCLTLNVASPAL